MAKFRVWEKDGAIFRAQAEWGVLLVNEVQGADGEWKPYHGDCGKPAKFGDDLGVREYPDPTSKA